MTAKQWISYIHSGEFDYLEDVIVNGGGDTVLGSSKHASSEELGWRTMICQTVFISIRLLKRQNKNSDAATAGQNTLLHAFLRGVADESVDLFEDGLQFLQRVSRKRELRGQCRKFLRGLAAAGAVDDTERLAQLASSELLCVRTYADHLLSYSQGRGSTGAMTLAGPGRASHSASRASAQDHGEVSGGDDDDDNDGCLGLSPGARLPALAAPGYLALAGRFDSPGYTTSEWDTISISSWTSVSTISGASAIPRGAHLPPVGSPVSLTSPKPAPKTRHYRLPSDSRRWSAVSKTRSSAKTTSLFRQNPGDMS